MASIDKVGAVGYNQDPVQPIGTKKVKKFDEELKLAEQLKLAGQLAGKPMPVAYMPDMGIGGILNGKGSGQAATQV